MLDLATLKEGRLPEGRPRIVPGDTVRVHVKVVEGGRERTQVFEGVVIPDAPSHVLELGR